MRWQVWTFALAASAAGTVFAAPGPDGGRAERVQMHRATAHALLEARDIDGALRELEAAYRHSCDDDIARELQTLQARRVATAHLDDDELAPVHVPRVDDDELAPVHVPRVDDDDDDLAPVPIDNDDDWGRPQLGRVSVADDDLAPVHVR